MLLPRRFHSFLVIVSLVTGSLSIFAQNDPQVAIAKKQAELDRQRIELEKKNLELKQRELDLEKARQEFEAQQSGRTARALTPPGAAEIRISSNENPLGPGKVALDAILAQFPEAGRYPFNSTPGETDLAAAIAAKFNAKPENVVLGAGSQEILKNAVRAFTSPTRALITASPTFENCTSVAKQLKHALVEVKVDSSMRLDVDQMAAAAGKGAGLVFFNNPNNPTATVHGAKSVAEQRRHTWRVGAYGDDVGALAGLN